MSTLTLGGSTLANKTGSVVSINDGVILPAGSVLQVVQAQDDEAFGYTNTSQWSFGNTSTRADNSHGGVVDNLNVTLTTKKANSNFLVCANLQNAGASAVGYAFGMNTYWSVDSYANPIIKGNPSNHGVYPSGQGVQSGFWVISTGDSGWKPLDTQVLKTGNTIAKNTTITFKIVVGTYYTSGGNTLYINRQHNSGNGAYRLVPVSTHTVFEIAT